MELGLASAVGNPVPPRRHSVIERGTVSLVFEVHRCRIGARDLKWRCSNVLVLLRLVCKSKLVKIVVDGEVSMFEAEADSIEVPPSGISKCYSTLEKFYRRDRDRNHRLLLLRPYTTGSVCSG